MSKQKSLTVNFILNLIKSLLTVMFPLVTFPYASRILGKDGLGKVDYSQSIINYFVLLAGLGVVGYAIREGARVRDDKKKFQEFANEIFTLNLVATLVSYIACVCVISIPGLSDYRILLYSFSLIIILSTVGVDWLYIIYEDYLYITIRAIIFQLISVIILFGFVKDKEDFVIYAWSIVISSAGSNILNYIHSKKYINLKLAHITTIKKHIKPVMMIFGLNVASTVYLNMDVTMIGAIKGDAEVGLYSVAIKLLRVITTLILSIKTIMMPRVSYYTENGDRNKFFTLNTITVKIILTVSIPAAIGLCFIAKPLMVLFSGVAFEPSGVTLQILAWNIIFSTFNGVVVHQVFIPRRRDKEAMFATIVGAIVNLCLNSLLIPIWGRNGAALATCLAEVGIIIYVVIKGRDIFDFKSIISTLIKSIIAGLSIVITSIITARYIANETIEMFVIIVISMVSYLLALIILKQEIIKMLIDSLKGRKNKDNEGY